MFHLFFVFVSFFLLCWCLVKYDRCLFFVSFSCFCAFPLRLTLCRGLCCLVSCSSCFSVFRLCIASASSSGTFFFSFCVMLPLVFIMCYHLLIFVYHPHRFGYDLISVVSSRSIAPQCSPDVNVAAAFEPVCKYIGSEPTNQPIAINLGCVSSSSLSPLVPFLFSYL